MPNIYFAPPPRQDPYAFANRDAMMQIFDVIGKAKKENFETQLLERYLADPEQDFSSLMAQEEPEGLLAKMWDVVNPKGTYRGGAGGLDFTQHVLRREMRDPLETEAMRADIDLTKARTKYYGEGGRPPSTPPLSEPQVAGYGEAMDERIKRARAIKWGPNYTDANLFRQWKIFASMYKFKNDTAREQVWNVFQNKVKNVGGKGGDETDWDPTDPKWREAIGLKAETRTGDNIRMQSSPDIALDPYWESLTPEEKKTAWEHLERGGSVEDLLNLLK